MPLDSAPSSFVFTVNFRAGAYVTSSIRKQRASSTRSAEAAAKALAHKLLPQHAATVERVGGLGVGRGEKWKAYA